MAKKFDIPPPPAGISNRWKGKLTEVTYGMEQFRFWWKGSGDRKSLDPWCESFGWDDTADQAPVVTGSITLRQSRVESPIPPIQIADQVIVDMRASPTGAWKEILRLRVSEPQRLATGQFTFQLENDAALLGLGKDSWRFPKGKIHKAGWKPWQIVEAVCDRSKVRVVMPRVGKPIKKFPAMLNSSPIDVINAALKHLKDTERKTLIRRFEQGTLYISERHYSPELLALGPQIIDASLVGLRRDGWATALTVRTAAETVKGKTAKGAKKAKHKAIVVNVTRQQQVKRYGYVHLTVYAHGASSAAEVRALGLAHLARVLRKKENLTITTPFIPGLRRGAYIRLALKELGLTQIVYVQSMSHNLSPGNATMDLTLSFDDPQITPAVDRVNDSSRGLAVKGSKKQTNPKPDGSKKDADTAKPPPTPPLLGTVATP